MKKEQIASAPHTNERYQFILEKVDNLPALPAIVGKLLKVIGSQDTSADDAARLIERDPALTSKMIRLANSAFYGIPRSISSVSSAVVILGFNTIRSLVLSASILKAFPSNKNAAFDRERFWQHSIVCAMAAKQIVRHIMRWKIMDPESAFCAGILHDIGKLVFNEVIPKQYVNVCACARNQNEPLLEMESAMLGINHAEVCKILAEKWALPIDLEYALGYHHSPDKAVKVVELIAAVHIANGLTHELGCGMWDKEVSMPECPEARTMLPITDDDYAQIRIDLAENIEKASDFFAIVNA